jgi:hypothetical protein
LPRDKAQSVGNGVWHKALIETPVCDGNGETDVVEKPDRMLEVETMF